jgi:hypothetical protein
MLLRKFIKHVKAENWFAVFLDFSVVVIGIFVALQVTEWKDNYDLKQLTTESLEKAKAEAIENNKLFSFYLESAEAREILFIENMENLLKCDDKNDSQMVFNETLNTFLYNFSLNLNTVALEQLYTQSFYAIYEDTFIILLNKYSTISKRYSLDASDNAKAAWNDWPFDKSPYFVEKAQTNDSLYFSRYKISGRFQDVCENQQYISDIHHQQLLRLANFDMHRELQERTENLIATIEKQVDFINGEQ